MVRAITIRILRQVLLVIVGAEVSFCTEIAQLCRRGHATGRLSVDVAVEPPVDQISVRSEQWSNGAKPEFDPKRRLPASALSAYIATIPLITLGFARHPLLDPSVERKESRHDRYGALVSIGH